MTQLSGTRITLETLRKIAQGSETVQLSKAAKEKMTTSRAVIEKIIDEGKVVYGVNTGFGRLSDVTVPTEEIEALQLNLVRSHACGIGNPLSREEARAMLVLRANVIAKGFSGARPALAEKLLKFLELDLVPVIPEKGSVGASGDLAPLAHLCLVVIGEGEAFYKGKRLTGAEALKEAGLHPEMLQAKEGLAMLNGTQAMVAVGGLALLRAISLVKQMDVAGAMSLEALLGTPTAFDPRIHEARPHPGQIEVARHLSELLKSSEIRESHKTGDSRVQDAYCLRCMPQVHGAARDALEFARNVLETETEGATDNPLIFGDDVLSGGNFHGAPVALALDFAAIALAHLAGISERRIDRLVNPDSNEGLPAFLTSHPGSMSGMMIAQVTAAALTNECRVLAHPACSDNTPTSGGKEDHVSMGMTSALKLRQVVENVEHLLAIEFLCAAQGLEFRRPLKSSAAIENAHAWIRTISPKLEADRALGGDIEAVAKALKDLA